MTKQWRQSSECDGIARLDRRRSVLGGGHLRADKRSHERNVTSGCRSSTDQAAGLGGQAVGLGGSRTDGGACFDNSHTISKGSYENRTVDRDRRESCTGNRNRRETHHGLT